MILYLIKKIPTKLYFKFKLNSFLNVRIRSIMYCYHIRSYNFLAFKINIFKYKIEFQIGENRLKELDKELIAA